MREIKFRAWSESAQKMHPIWKKTDDERGEYILMQFTGLRDKNGKAIYEGDIVQYRGGNPGIGGYKEIAGGNYKVVWEIYKFRLRRTDQKRWLQSTKGIGMIWQSPKEWEVIGNIYESPELLK